MKAKYNPVPTAEERRFHLWLMDTFPCVCGCGGPAECAHHPLTRHPEQRWRRDHEFVVPMTDHCHRALHAMGRESLFTDKNLAEAAWQFRAQGIDQGYLQERLAA